MASIYEISDAFMALQEQLDRMIRTEDGEFREDDVTDVYEAYMQSAMDMQEKIDNTVAYIKDLKAEAEAIADEIANLQHRKRTKLNKADWLEECVDYALEKMQTDRWENQRHKVTYRTSHSVFIPDEEAFRMNADNQKRFLKPQEPRIDREAIKRAITQGEAVFGAEIKDNKLIQIK